MAVDELRDGFNVFEQELSGKESLGSPCTVNSPEKNAKSFYGSKNLNWQRFKRLPKDNISGFVSDKEISSSSTNVKKEKKVTSKSLGSQNRMKKSKQLTTSAISSAKKLKNGSANGGRNCKVKNTVTKHRDVEEENASKSNLWIVKQKSKEVNASSGKKNLEIKTSFNGVDDQTIIGAFQLDQESSILESHKKAESSNSTSNVSVIVEQICRKYENISNGKTHSKETKSFQHYHSSCDTSGGFRLDEDSCSVSSYDSDEICLQSCFIGMKKRYGDGIEIPNGEDMEISDNDDEDNGDVDNDGVNYDYDHCEKDNLNEDNDDTASEKDDNDDSNIDSSLCSFIDAANSFLNGSSSGCPIARNSDKNADNVLQNGFNEDGKLRDEQKLKRLNNFSNANKVTSYLDSPQSNNYGQVCSPSLESLNTSPTSEEMDSSDSVEDSDTCKISEKQTDCNKSNQRDNEASQCRSTSISSDRATLLGYFQRKPKIPQQIHEDVETKSRSENKSGEKYRLKTIKNETKLSPYSRPIKLKSMCDDNSIVKDLTIEDFATNDRSSSLKIDFSSKAMTPNCAKQLKRMKNMNKHTKTKNETKKLEQLYIDVGQKDFGHTACPTCGMVYTKTLEEDSLQHAKYHQKMMQKLKFKGWKKERVLQEFHDGRIIQVNPEDNMLHKKKIAELREIVDGELGFSYSTVQYRDQEKVFVFISNQRIVGCAIAVPINKAYPAILTTNTTVIDEKRETSKATMSWCCSSEPVKAICGISRIWVLKQARRTNVASRLVDAVRNNFIFGEIIAKQMLAFSDPTTEGRLFAQSYCGTQNILVFR